MTKKKFEIVFWSILAAYITFILIGGWLYYLEYSSSMTNYYDKFKDLVTFLSVWIVAWFTYSYQQRNSFLKHLQITWNRLIKTVHKAIEYTYLQPTPEEAIKMMTDMRIIRDDLRSLYKNVRQNKNQEGLYPFVRLEKIEQLFKTYCTQRDFSENTSEDKREEIVALWEKLKEQVIEEFDRSEPSRL